MEEKWEEASAQLFFELYLQEMKQIEACTPEETQALLEKLPDPQAEIRLIEGNLLLTAQLAMEFLKEKNSQKTEEEISDLIQEGNIALTLYIRQCQDKTVEAFIRGRDAAVREAMREYLADQEQNQKTAEHLAEAINDMNIITSRLAEEFGRAATAEEIASRMNMTVDEVKILMREVLNAVNVQTEEKMPSSEDLPSEEFPSDKFL